MTGQMKKVCCFSALCWTKTLAWLHIVYGVLGSAGCGIVLAIGYSVSIPTEDQEEFEEQMAMVIAVLIYMVFGLVLSIFHLHATKKEKINHLWWWVGLQSLGVLSFTWNLIEGIQMKNPDLLDEAASFTGILKVGFEFFTILVVLQRIREIRASRGGREVSEDLEHFMDL